MYYILYSNRKKKKIQKKMDAKTACSILEVGHNSPVSTIRRSFRRLSRKYHPDRAKDESEAITFDDLKKAHDYMIHLNKDNSEESGMLFS